LDRLIKLGTVHGTTKGQIRIKITRLRDILCLIVYNRFWHILLPKELQIIY